MKKLLGFIIVCSFLLVACGTEEETTSSLVQQQGLIAEIIDSGNERAQILVIPNVAQQDIANKTTEQLIQLARDNDGAFYTYEVAKFKGLQVGVQIIAYWSGTQLDSDPPQRSLEKVEILTK